MRPIPPALKRVMESDPYYRFCARRNGQCEGRITWEHAIIYAGRQVNEKWAIIPLCVHHHLGTGLDKELNEYIAIRRATPEELAAHSRRDWAHRLRYLTGKYS